MKPPNRLWLTSLFALACLLGLARQFQTHPVYAQQDPGEYDDGTFYISSFVDVDSNYNLSLDSYMEVEFDDEEDIDEIEVDAYPDEDGTALACADCYADGDDYEAAELKLQSNAPVAPGHEYGLESDGFACYDDGEGDCDFEYVGYAYASKNVQSPPPQITSLSTYSVHQGDQGTLTVTGTNLVQGTGDQLTVNLSRNAGPFTPVGIPTATSATFSYDFTSYPVGSYNLTVQNNEAESDGTSFTVSAASPSIALIPPLDPCAITSSPKVAFTSVVPNGTPGGSGTMAVSFSGTAFAAISPTVAYGPYSTPESIAANIAALVTSKYLQFGLNAKAFGPNIIFGGTSTLGTVSVSAGSSFTTNTSAAAANTAALACYAAPAPRYRCLGLFPSYDALHVYTQEGISETPREHITRKHILGPPTLAPLNTVYVANQGARPNFVLIQAYNFFTVLFDPLHPRGPYLHTFPKRTEMGPGFIEESGFIGVDAAGSDLYTNNLYLSPDRCTVITSFPTK